MISAAATPRLRSASESPRSLIGFALTLFLVACVFDPADRLFGLKVDLFLVCWLITFVVFAAGRERPRMHLGLLVYTALFLLVPTLSIAWYWLVDGSEPFEGFQLLKGYLLITLAALLFLHKTNLLPLLASVLTILAIAVIAVFVAVVIWPDLYSAIYLFGGTTGIVFLDKRDYGSGLILTQIYFVTSPMLAVSIAYYFNEWKRAVTHSARLRFGILVLVNAAGMLLAGTRNNIAVSVLLPIALFLLYSRNKVVNGLLCAGALVVLALVFSADLQVLLDPLEYSNSVKLALLEDYGVLFADPIRFLFGQGLGAYYSWAARGGAYFYVSELTYLELVRNFGVFGALTIFVLLCFPLVYAFVINRSFQDKHIVVGYAFYLLMCASNPNLFSSMGILILSVVLARIFLVDAELGRAAARAGS